MEENSSKTEAKKTEDEAPDELIKVVAADDATGHDLQRLAMEVSLEGINKTEEEAPDELIKVVAVTTPRARTSRG